MSYSVAEESLISERTICNVNLDEGMSWLFLEGRTGLGLRVHKQGTLSIAV